MSYSIDIAHMELQTVARIDIFHASENFTSARKSQFQCIGWILDIVSQVQSKVKKCDIVNPDYAFMAMTSIAMLSDAQATELLAQKKLQDQFEYVWSILDQDERDFALHMDFHDFHNFWPGFDAYSQVWSQSLKSSSEPNPEMASMSEGL